MTQGERRLAAIMFTDMVGYTALGQKNETLALALVEEQRKLIRPILSRHKGREVKTIGDAFLVEFPNAIDAVRCAYDIQRAIRELDPSLESDKKIHLRIGVHVGEVVESNGDIAGDAVNLASRIEPLSEDGGICLTRQVYDQVHNKFELPLESLGQKALKNVVDAQEVFRVVLPWSREPDSALSEKMRIAVLPFDNMSPDPADEFFADGLTEEMITELSAISGLGVIARTSVMRFKGGGKGIRDIGKELGVGVIVEGSFRKAGNKIRIVAQLVNAKNEEHLWASKYDRELNDIFEVQSEIAQSIAKALALKLMPASRELAVSTENLEAYTLCLKAHASLHARTKSGNDQAILLFNEALKVDPSSARANAGLSDCYHVAADWRFMEFVEGEAKAQQYATRALALAPNLAEAHATLGSILHLQRIDYAAAESELRTAISLNPSYASAHQWYADLLMELGRTEESRTETMKAIELDPLSPVIGLQLAWLKYYTGSIEGAEVETSNLIKAYPGLASAYSARAYFRTQRGNKEQAKSDIEMYHNLTDDECAYLVYSATLEAIVGDKSQGVLLMSEALPLIEKSWNPSTASPCWYYAAMGEKDEFFKWAEWSIDRRAISPKSLIYDQILLKLRGDPRYEGLFTKLNLHPQVPR